MNLKLTIGGKEIEARENLLDRAIRFVDPILANQRLQARFSAAAAGSYFGGSRSRRAMKTWGPPGGDADADLLPDLSALRERSRDLVRNAPIATGAINTTCTNVIGTGLIMHSQIDPGVLGMTEAEAEEWEKRADLEWQLWSESPECDSERKLNFAGIQELCFRQVLENGDVLVNIPRFKRGIFPYFTKLQVIEADRLCNPDGKTDTETIMAGVEKDEHGAPKAYHILKQHPGAAIMRKPREWDHVAAFSNKSELPNILHLFRVLRPGQTRGLPFLAPIIEPLKQLDRYTEAEIMAAVVSSMFTVFVKTESGETEFAEMVGTSGNDTRKAGEEDYKLGSGTIVGLTRDQDVEFANPGRPNQAFEPFITSLMNQMGMSLEIPREILMKCFTTSYTAARAAFIEAWKFFSSRRQWTVTSLCGPIYEIFLYEAIASGRLHAPGFFADPLIRKAYCGATWTGPAKGMIQEVDEIVAAGKRIEISLSTREKETAELTGGSWEKNLAQLKKEQVQLIDAKLPTFQEKTVLNLPAPTRD
ncbi:MAG: phage portal protein [Candidatus Eisenbacteria bacterium]|nr:phage portal protein [Candidatus Eisenbacteria bacterium]